MEDSGTADLLYSATLELARKSQGGRRYSDSFRYFEEAAKLRPQEPEPHRGMAEIYRLTRRPAQATAEQEEADRLYKRLGKLN